MNYIALTNPAGFVMRNGKIAVFNEGNAPKKAKLLTVTILATNDDGTVTVLVNGAYASFTAVKA
jgi:hypothetical protein